MLRHAQFLRGFARDAAVGPQAMSQLDTGLLVRAPAHLHGRLARPLAAMLAIALHALRAGAAVT